MATLRRRADGRFFIDYVENGQRKREAVTVDGVAIRDPVIAAAMFAEWCDCQPDEIAQDSPRIVAVLNYYQDTHLAATNAAQATRKAARPVLESLSLRHHTHNRCRVRTYVKRSNGFLLYFASRCPIKAPGMAPLNKNSLLPSGVINAIIKSQLRQQRGSANERERRWQAGWFWELKTVMVIAVNAVVLVARSAGLF